MDDDRRQHLRFPASWRVRIICVCRKTGRPTVIEGKTFNVSIAGVCLSSEHNVCPDKAVILEISVPPVMPGVGRTVLRFEACSRFTVLSEQHAFRTGLEFVQLSTQDESTLARHLEAHHGTDVLTNYSPCS